MELQVLRRSGTEQEKAHAQRVLPVVSAPHRLLVTLVLCNAIATEVHRVSGVWPR
jgi:metal transporter CNNM